MKTAEDILKDKHPAQIISIASDQTIAAAIGRMNEHNIGAILISQGDAFIGIWTERDLLRAMGRAAFDPRAETVGAHMQSPLHSAEHDTPIDQLEEMFVGLFIRHVLIKKKQQFIGLLSIGDVLRASLLEKDCQIKKLNTIASWQYYENWGWDRNKKKK